MIKPTHIIIHCSDSTWGCARAINGWHVKRKFSKIGYHFVILNGLPWGSGESIEWLDGSIECGRIVDIDATTIEKGAHCKAQGYNSKSIGICLIGRSGVYTDPQMISAVGLAAEMSIKYAIPISNILGHCEVDNKKTCPEIDMNLFRSYVELEI